MPVPFKFYMFVSRPRLVLSRFEVESGEGPVESVEDEEEVWLFWKDSVKEIKSKSIRELAQDAKEGQKEDQEIISYYRSANQPRVKVYQGKTKKCFQIKTSVLSLTPLLVHCFSQIPAEPVCTDVFGPPVLGH